MAKSCKPLLQSSPSWSRKSTKIWHLCWVSSWISVPTNRAVYFEQIFAYRVHPKAVYFFQPQSLFFQFKGSVHDISFSIWVFFHEHSRFTGQQGKGEGIYLTPLYHFNPLHGHLDISRTITAESSPLHIAGSRTRTGNLWFPSASH